MEGAQLGVEETAACLPSGATHFANRGQGPQRLWNLYGDQNMNFCVSATHSGSIIVLESSFKALFNSTSDPTPNLEIQKFMFW